jgi:S1-C subfamily serine protease
MSRILWFPILVALVIGNAWSADLPATIAKVKPSVVGVGTFMAIRKQQHKLTGTGFVVAGGRYVVTNSHVVPRELDDGRRETIAVYFPAQGNQAKMYKAKVVKRDIAHDLCLLRFDGPGGRSMRLGNSGDVREGELYAFTGFPILNALGLHPVTHRGIVSAISPIVVPVASGKHLNRDVLSKLSKPFDVFQLDATAYPGNSGSPLFEIGTGRVVGVINSVYVKKTKEMAIASPSGISYAIPVGFVRNLLQAAGLKF